MYITMPGKKPASVRPKRKRNVAKLAIFHENIMADATTPQESMIRAIHLRAPTFSRMRLLGTSKMRYPQKNIPTPKPYWALVKPRSWGMVNAAAFTFKRSRILKTYKRNINGSRRRDTFRSVVASRD